MREGIVFEQIIGVSRREVPVRLVARRSAQGDVPRRYPEFIERE